MSCIYVHELYTSTCTQKSCLFPSYDHLSLLLPSSVCLASSVCSNGPLNHRDPWSIRTPRGLPSSPCFTLCSESFEQTLPGLFLVSLISFSLLPCLSLNHESDNTFVLCVYLCRCRDCLRLFLSFDWGISVMWVWGIGLLSVGKRLSRFSKAWPRLSNRTV